MSVPAISARGRNGVFIPRRVYVTRHFDSTDNDQITDKLFIEINSRRPGNTSPIVLEGTAAAVTHLLGRIQDAVAKVMGEAEGSCEAVAVPSGVPKLTKKTGPETRKIRFNIND